MSDSRQLDNCQLGGQRPLNGRPNELSCHAGIWLVEGSSESSGINHYRGVSPPRRITGIAGRAGAGVFISCGSCLAMSLPLCRRYVAFNRTIIRPAPFVGGSPVRRVSCRSSPEFLRVDGLVAADYRRVLPPGNPFHKLGQCFYGFMLASMVRYETS